MLFDFFINSKYEIGKNGMDIRMTSPTLNNICDNEEEVNQSFDNNQSSDDELMSGEEECLENEISDNDDNFAEPLVKRYKVSE